ncbi:uncharacterized protein RJT20DRAFT_133561 [Scheffersomyces xylosifermentans]|uniref:uncharacterized protein n=1 Tax=Scheffersomyces xylosifermentans TaxID=1304137 RepID=UPI00315D661C
MDEDELQKELDGLDNLKVKKPTAFKKKVVKGQDKKSIQRSKLSFIDIEENDDLEIKSSTETDVTILRSTNSNLNFIANRRKFQNKTSSTNKSKTVLKKAFPSNESEGQFGSTANNEAEAFNVELDLDQDPENNPVIENIEELDDGLKQQFSIRASPFVREPPKKYVPIETNRFEPLSDKEMKKQLKAEYADEYNYDDGTEKEPEKQEDTEDIVLTNDDLMVADEPVQKERSNLEINQNFYNLEISSEENSDTEEENRSKSHNKITIKEIPTLDEQIESIRETLQDLQKTRIEYEAEKLKIQNDLRIVQARKESLLSKLYS